MSRTAEVKAQQVAVELKHVDTLIMVTDVNLATMASAETQRTKKFAAVIVVAHKDHRQISRQADKVVLTLVFITVSDAGGVVYSDTGQTSGSACKTYRCTARRCAISWVT